MSDARSAELAARLDAVRARIAALCDPAEVTLVAVSKTFPAADVLSLHRLGVADFGENYDAEAAQKAAALEAMGVSLRWHFVGGLQRNKARSVARYAAVVQSVDRPELATALGNAAARAGRVVDALVQVKYDADPDRAGARPEDVPALADLVAATEGLRLAGVMCVPPLGEPARPVYAALREVAARVRADHPGATTISAGMTHDLEEALAEGANCLRVGTALFGDRAPRVG